MNTEKGKREEMQREKVKKGRIKREIIKVDFFILISPC
jgi:hypothetical protein